MSGARLRAMRLHPGPSTTDRWTVSFGWIKHLMKAICSTFWISLRNTLSLPTCTDAPAVSNVYTKHVGQVLVKMPNFNSWDIAYMELFRVKDRMDTVTEWVWTHDQLSYRQVIWLSLITTHRYRRCFIPILNSTPLCQLSGKMSAWNKYCATFSKLKEIISSHYL